MSVLHVRIFKRHPLSGRRELNTRIARNRDYWFNEAMRLGSGEMFWRDRAAKRCELDGHLWGPTGDGKGRYCGCCGRLESGDELSTA